MKGRVAGLFAGYSGCTPSEVIFLKSIKLCFTLWLLVEEGRLGANLPYTQYLNSKRKYPEFFLKERKDTASSNENTLTYEI